MAESSFICKGASRSSQRLLNRSISISFAPATRSRTLELCSHLQVLFSTQSTHTFDSFLSIRFILGSFYKCITFYLTQCIYQGFVGCTGTSLYDPWTLAAYNIFFTSFCVICIGCTEQDATDKTLLKHPQLYSIGQNNLEYNSNVITRWVLTSLYHTAVLILVPFLCFGAFTDQSDLIFSDHSHALMGSVVYSAVVLVVNLKVGWWCWWICKYFIVFIKNMSRTHLIFAYSSFSLLIFDCL